MVFGLSNPFASRVTEMEVSGIRKLFEGAPPDAINLSIGEPDFQPPDNVIRAMEKAAENGHNKYGPIAGIMPLREAIAARLKRHKTDISAKNICVTMGASEGLFIAAMSFYEQGCEVLIPDPGFVFYRPHTLLFGAKPVEYHLRQENNFQPEIEEIKSKITARTKAIVVNSPSNPTGGAYTMETVRAISDIANDRGLVVISDEVYDDIVYDTDHISFLGKADKCILVNSFSKSYAMTGWRIGYVASEPNVIERLSTLHYHVVACPTTPIQMGALEALTGPQEHLQNMKKAFNERRKLITRELNMMDGISCPTPNGAFYVFPSYSYKIDDVAFSKKLLSAGVISVPGSSFGKHGAGHIRFSYANSAENIKEGMRRVEETLKKL